MTPSRADDANCGGCCGDADAAAAGAAGADDDGRVQTPLNRQ